MITIRRAIDRRVVQERTHHQWASTAVAVEVEVHLVTLLPQAEQVGQVGCMVVPVVVAVDP